MTATATFRRIIRLLLDEADATVRQRFAIALTLVVAGGALAALAPLALKGLIDGVAGAASGSGPSDGAETIGALAPSVAVLGAAYLLALCCSRLLTELRPWIYGYAEQRLYGQLSRRFFGHLLDLRLEFHLDRRTGALGQTLSQAVAGCQLLVTHMINSILPVLVEVVAVAVILLHLEQPVLVVTFLATAVVYLAIFSSSMALLTRTARAVSSSAIGTHAVLADSLLNYETIKYFNAEASARERYAHATTDLEAQWSSLRRQRLWVGLAVTATFTISVSVCIVAAAQGVAVGTLTIGGFVLANVYMLQIVRPLEMMGAALRDVSQALGFVRPLLVVLEQPTEESQAKSPVAAPVASTVKARTEAATIWFENVVFGYHPATPVLKGLSLELAAGRTIAVVGASGTGKSSLVRLLLRLYEPQQGRILLDGMPLHDIPASDVRAAVGLVPQDTVLFNDTIAYNIGIGKPSASRSEIERAARLAHLHEFILALPAAYDTVVGERGLKLSGGERQRIAIARAVIKRPRLYVFDEATSSLDSHTEAEILRNLQEVSAGCTTLVIAHRLSTVLHADEIIVLNNGQVLERGSHSALLLIQGTYAQLWKAQLPKRAA